MPPLHRVSPLTALAFVGAMLPAAANDWAVEAAGRYDVWTDQVYATAGGRELQLDVYVPRRQEAPNATVVHFHGGGWVEGRRADDVMWLLPWLARGYTVVNADYRLASVAAAPAAVEDARCALRFVARHADRFRFDTSRVIVTGVSAGAHLALLGGLLRPDDGFDASCPTDEAVRWTSATLPPMKVAAVVNWFGVTDVADLADGPNARHWAREWLGARRDRAELARAVSPVAFVRDGAPPVVTVHGDKDDIVPYAQALALHEKLAAARVPNELVSLSGGHGQFKPAKLREAWTAVLDFLAQKGLVPQAR